MVRRLESAFSASVGGAHLAGGPLQRLDGEEEEDLESAFKARYLALLEATREASTGVLHVRTL